MNDNTARTDRYLSGQMDTAERETFQAELASDAQLAEELALQRDMEAFLHRSEQRNALKRQLKEMGGAYFQAEKQEAKVKALPRRRLLWIGAVAAAAALVLFVLRPALFGPGLFEQYAEYPRLALAEKSAGEPVVWSSAETAFNSGDYATAEKILSNYVAEHTADRQAQLFLGICRMELGSYEDARHIFAGLAADADFADHAGWFTALSHLKAGDKAACRDALGKIATASRFYTQAQDLLGKLE